MTFLSNLIVSISNGSHAKLETISCRLPQLNEFSYVFQILTILQKQGVIRGFSYKKKVKYSNKVSINDSFIIYLKYNGLGESVIKSIFIISKASRPVYVKTSSFWQPQTSSGFFVLSTKYGIITDIEARRFNLGGYLLFGVT